MDQSQNPPHVQMDTSSVIPTPVLWQTSVTVSFDTNALIAAHQGAAWKISGWPNNIAIHHAKGCACCHEYINHLLRAQSLGQINLLHPDIENAVQSSWPAFINSIEINADECVQGQISNLHVQIDEMKDAPCVVKKFSWNAEAALIKEYSRAKDLEQELKDLKNYLQVELNASVLPPITVVTVVPMMWVVAPAWSLPQPEAGPSCQPPSRHEMRPSSLPKEVNLRSWIAMEVDDWEPKWLTLEEGFKPSNKPLPVSKRQQRKGLGPSTYISSFNSIEALEKNYLAQLPSHSLTDPTFHREREGVLNRIMMDCIAMKNRVLGPSLSIDLPPPGEPSVGFPWRPVPEHLVSLPGIREPLTVGDPPLSQTG